MPLTGARSTALRHAQPTRARATCCSRQLSAHPPHAMMMHTVLLLPARLGCASGRLAAVAAAAAGRVAGHRPRRAARHVPSQQQEQRHDLLPDQPGRWGARAVHQQAQSGRPGVRTAATGGGPAADAPGSRQRQRAPKQQVLAPPAPPGASAEEAFYAEAAGSFEELGIAPAVAAALKSAGFVKPSRVQELVVPRILSGSDVVVAAETGSGKTLAYIAPMATIMQAKAAAGQRPPGAADVLAAARSSSSGSSDARPWQQQPQQQAPPRWMGLVLCPNTALCQQVVRLAASLTADDGRPLLRACHVSSSSPPPFDPPDIMVTTPGALITLFNDRGYSYGSQWTAEGVAARAAFVVVDEADLLCQGGYAKDLTRLLDAFKASERRLIEAQVMAETGLDRDAFSRLSRHVKAACWEGGTPAMIKAGFKPSSSSSSSDGQQQQDGAPSDSSSSSRQRHGPYFSRQYLFVAATMPTLTKGDVGIELQRRFKDAVWVSGDMLHQVKPHVTHTWVPVGRAASSGGSADDDTAVADDCLLQAITSDPDYQAGRARVLVFTTNTASADRVSAMLHDRGVANLVYHKNLPAADQAAALAAMRQPLPLPAAGSDAADGSSASGNLLLVSTDAAARGIDLPLVTHVIQADFASNAVEFLHRVGRTARAGRAGKVTSLYGRADTVLAEALRRYVREGRPVEECFSRNRSFSRKVKRYGGFVPRGQEGPQQPAAAAAGGAE